jgi:hypothetical protein
MLYIHLPILPLTTELAPYTIKIIYGRNYSQKDPADKCFDCTSVTNWTIENVPDMLPLTVCFRQVYFYVLNVSPHQSQVLGHAVPLC